MTTYPPRAREQRRRDTEHRLAHDIDCWVATASTDGVPHLVPLSFDWDGVALLVATLAVSPTGRNLADTGVARVGLGDTRDVSMLDCDVEVVELDAVADADADGFVARTGFDPRSETASYRWFRLRPRRIQAWREADELRGRELMRAGSWLVGDTDEKETR